MALVLGAAAVFGRGGEQRACAVGEHSGTSAGSRRRRATTYDAAFEDYRQAHLKKPSDLRYRTSYESMRFKAANMHVDRGRVLRQSGDVDGAINEFARALQIDPGNQAAAQELQVMEKRAPGGGEPAGRLRGRGGASAGNVAGAGDGRRDAVPAADAEGDCDAGWAGDAAAGVGRPDYAAHGGRTRRWCTRRSARRRG